MSESDLPTPDEIAARAIVNGRTTEGFAALVEVVEEGVERGVIRENISCEESRREWLLMARRRFVDDNPEPRFPIDAETGIHNMRCPDLKCRNLVSVYYDVLRPSTSEDSERIATFLDQLEASFIEPGT